MTTLNLSDIKNISEHVQHYWGSHLFIKIVKQGTPCMDWKEVLIPEEYTEWSREKLTAIMLHEWGHRMISPVSPKTAAIWRKTTQKMGLTKDQAQLLINIATDAWVDKNYLENPDWKSIYWEGEKDNLLDLISVLDKSEPKKNRNKPDIFTILAAFYHHLLSETDETKYKSHKKLSNSEYMHDILNNSQDLVKLIDNMWSILYMNSDTQLEKIKKLTELLKEFLPKKIPIYIYTLYPFSGNEKHSGDITDRIWIDARQAGLSNKDIEDLFGKKQVEKFKTQSERLKMYSRIVPVVQKFLSKRTKLDLSGYKIWKTGRPLRELDLLGTIQRFSLPIPNINTLSRNYTRRGTHTGRGCGNVILILDDSGSTTGKVLLREKEASFAVIAAARYFGDPVGCIVFGSDVTKSIPPTTNYQRIEDEICSLSSDSGGTELTPALEEALRMMGELQHFSIMLMTDAEFFDTIQVKKFIRRLLPFSKIAAFCFNSKDYINQMLGDIIGPTFHVYAASPSKPFAETALEEIYGTKN